MSGLAVLAAGGWGLVVVLVGVLAVGWRSARRRDGLLARASHELRGPLGAARLAVGAAARDPRGGALAAAEAELERAGRALDDLDLARRGRTGEAHVELVRVDALVVRHAPAWRAVAAAHGTSLVVEPLVGRAVAAVRADPMRLAQALGNVVANAAEHGGGRVRVGVRAVGGRIAVDVRDDGPGLSLVPSRDAVAPASDRGHGLGVAVAVAAACGGTLAAVPRPAGARGAHVVLELPRAPEPRVAPMRSVAPDVGRGVLLTRGGRA